MHWDKVSYVSISLPSTCQPLLFTVICRRHKMMLRSFARPRKLAKPRPRSFAHAHLENKKMAHFCCRNTTLWRLSGAKLRLLAMVGDRSLSSLSVSPLMNWSFHQNYAGSNKKLPLSFSSRSLSTDSVFYPIIHATETSFKAVHTFSHLPWWGVVISSTIILRLVLTLPLAVHQNRTIAKMELLLPTLKEYQEAVKHNIIVKCRRANLPVEEANRRLKKAVKFSIPKTFREVVFFSRLRKWHGISMLRKVAVPIVWLYCRGSSCHSGSPSLSL